MHYIHIYIITQKQKDTLFKDVHNVYIEDFGYCTDGINILDPVCQPSANSCWIHIHLLSKLFLSEAFFLDNAFKIFAGASRHRILHHKLHFSFAKLLRGSGALRCNIYHIKKTPLSRCLY